MTQPSAADSNATLPRVEARALCLVRGSAPLFSDLSFSLAAGCALVLRGPNGVGKTSLLRILAGLTRADAGEVVLDGRKKNCGQKLTIKFFCRAPREYQASL